MDRFAERDPFLFLLRFGGTVFCLRSTFIQLLFLFIERVISDAQMPCDIGCRLLGILHEPNRFALELRGVLLALVHRTLPGAFCPLSKVSDKPRLAQSDPCILSAHLSGFLSHKIACQKSGRLM